MYDKLILHFLKHILFAVWEQSLDCVKATCILYLYRLYRYKNAFDFLELKALNITTFHKQSLYFE